MTGLEIKSEIASYLRFERQMPLVCFEADYQDIIAITKSREEIWVEVKASISDLVSDRRKSFHQRQCAKRNLPLFRGRGARLVDAPAWLLDYAVRREPNRYYFAVSNEIADKAQQKIEAFFPWAGLLVAWPHARVFAGHTTTVRRDAEQFHKNRVSIERISELVKAQSASLANIAAKFARYASVHTNGKKATFATTTT